MDEEIRKEIKKEYGSRKGTVQKYFANPKKYLESISFDPQMNYMKIE